MTKFDSNLEGTMLTEFSVGGPDGIKIVDAGTVLSVEDSASSPVNVSGADPVLAQHFVTKTYGDTNYGGAGSIGLLLFNTDGGLIYDSSGDLLVKEVP